MPEIGSGIYGYSALSNNSYGPRNDYTNLGLYDLVGSSVDYSTGFSAGTYQNLATGEVVVAFAGTDFWSYQDIKQNAYVAAGLYGPQGRQARAYAQGAIAKYGSVTLTGHSLGGYLAQLSIQGGVNKVVTFSSPGIISLIGSISPFNFDYVAPEDVDVIHVFEDTIHSPLSAFIATYGKHVKGKIIFVDTPISLFTPMQGHRIESIQNSTRVRCFSADTQIYTGISTCRPIAEICVGDVVLSFDPESDQGRGALVPRRVTRLYRNVTTEWLRLTWTEGCEVRELVTTPGHHFLDEFGQFPAIKDIVEAGRATVVLASGEVAEVTAERIFYSAETAHLFERAEVYGMSSGSAALQPVAEEGWQTYNFEVEDLHTYVAGGVRVHNISDPVAHNWVGIEDDFLGLGVAAAISGRTGFTFSSEALNAAYNSLGGAKGYGGTSVGWATAAAWGVLGTPGLGTGKARAAFKAAFLDFKDAPVTKAIENYAFSIGVDAYRAGNAGGGYLGPSAAGFETASAERFAESAYQNYQSFFDAYAAVNGYKSRFTDEAYAAYDATLEANPPKGLAGIFDIFSGAPRNHLPADVQASQQGAANSSGSSGGFFGGLFGGGTGTGVVSPRDDQPNTSSYDSGGGGGSSKPILLDLDDDGIEIVPLSQSTMFMDAGGDGLLHRTAWAGQGDGVLFYDPDDIGEITEKRQYIFTEWDPTAASDLQALRSIFDSNDDGVFNSSDAEFSDFKVLVTEDDSSTQGYTLAQLGIVSIDLTGDTTEIELPDGSHITGQTTFTRTDSSTGTVADTALVAEANGRRVDQVDGTDGSGNRTLETTAYNADGSIAYTISSVFSPDGSDITHAYDDNGDGAIDRLQTIGTVVDTNGDTIETVSNFAGAVLVDAILLNRTVTTKSADGLTTTIERDSTGGGWFDQEEVRAEQGNGSFINTISDRAEDGSVIRSEAETVSADGLTRSTATDEDGDSDADLTTIHGITINLDGSRDELITLKNTDNSTRSSVSESVSADGKTKVVARDLDGDGNTDTQENLSISIDGNGVTTSVLTMKNGNGSTRSSTTTSQSADTLVKTTASDLDGDGTVDVTTAEDTTINMDGSRETVTTVTNTDTSLRAKEKVTLGADKVTSETWVDQNQDGIFQSTDLVRSVAVDGGTGDRTTTIWSRNTDGSFSGKQVSVASEDGLSRDTEIDADGDGDTDSSISDVTVVNGSGVATRTVSTFNQNASLRRETVTTTSADGLTVTTDVDWDGDGVYDRHTSDVRVLESNGSTTHTVSVRSGNNTLLSETVTTESADRLTRTVTDDLNGDGNTDRIFTSVMDDDGSVAEETYFYNPDGSVVSRIESEISANGLVSVTRTDLDNDGAFDDTIRQTVALGSDGARTTTTLVLNFDGSVRRTSVQSVSDDGLVTTDITSFGQFGGGWFEDETQSTVLNADGSRTTTSEIRSPGLLSGWQTTISDDELTVVENTDSDGNGVYELVQTTVTDYQSNGGTVTTTERRNELGGLIYEEVKTADDTGRSIVTTVDHDGDGDVDMHIDDSILNDGTQRHVAEQRNSLGGVMSSDSVDVSDNGLIRTQEVDFDGDSTVDRSMSSMTTLALDGSRTTVVFDFEGTSTLIEKQTTTVSADGLEKTVLVEDGAGADLRSHEMATVHNQDGSIQVTSEFRHGDGSLESLTITDTSADGRSIVTTSDIDGDGYDDHHFETAIENDGSVTKIASDLDQSGSILRSKTTVLSDDGLTQTSDFDVDGDGIDDSRILDGTYLTYEGNKFHYKVKYTYVVDQGNPPSLELKEAATINESDDGVTVVSEFDLDANGIYEYKIESNNYNNPNGSIDKISYYYYLGGITSFYLEQINPNGLEREIYWGLGGYAQYQQSSEITTIDNDGSTTKTVTSLGEQSELLSSKTINVSADGRSSSTVEQRSFGLGTRTTDIDKEILADGSTSVETARSDSSGLLDKATVFTRADGRLVTIERDADGDGNLDQFDEFFTSMSGERRQTITNYDSAGTVLSSSLTITSADGSLITTELDDDGDDTSDRRRVLLLTENADGSVESELSEYDLPGETLTEFTRTFVSADGLRETTEKDLEGNGTVDRSIIVTTDLSGATSMRTENNETAQDPQYMEEDKLYWKPEIAEIINSSTRADGNITTTSYDYDGDGYFEVIANTAINVDGSVTGTITETKRDGEVTAVGTISTSADGEVSILSKDIGADGSIDYKAVTVSLIDGQKKTTITNYDPAGLVYAETTAHQSVNGKSVWYESTGGSGENVLSGGAGDDILTGGAGDDVYEIGYGEGNDTIVEAVDDGFDTLRFGSTISFGDVSLEEDGNDLLLVVEPKDPNDAAQTVRISGALADSGLVDRLEFGDGTVIDIDEIGIVVASGDSGESLTASESSTIYPGLNVAGYSIGYVSSVDAVDWNATPAYTGIASEISISGTSWPGGPSDLFALRYSGYMYVDEATNYNFYLGSDDGSVLIIDGVEIIDNDGLHAYITEFGTVGLSEGYHFIEVLYFEKDGGDNLSLYWTKSGLPFQQYSSGVFSTGISDASAYQTWTEGGGGNDTLTGTSSADLMLGKAGDDTISGGDGADRIDGGEGADVLSGQEGDDAIFGSTGNDTISGGDGNDLIEGGAGDDELQGNIGNDEYLFSIGDGQDVIYEANPSDGVDTISFADAIGLSDLRPVVQGNDLVVQFGTPEGQNPQDQITITGAASALGIIERIRFADGLVVDLSAFGHFDSSITPGTGVSSWLVGTAAAETINGSSAFDVIIGGDGHDTLYGYDGADLLEGNDGNDQISAGDGSDTILGGAGDDILTGGAGDDIYEIGYGEGNDTIVEAVDDGFDTLRFGSTISFGDVSLEEDGNDLLLVVEPKDPNDAAQTVRISGALADSGLVDRLEFGDGTVIDIDEIGIVVASGDSGESLTASDSSTIYPGLNVAGYSIGYISSVDAVDWNATPAYTGIASEISTNGTSWPGGPSDLFALRYSGYMYIDEATNYNFYLGSDDGSVLIIDGVEIIDNDGLHAYITEFTTVGLIEGYHSIEVRYFERDGGDNLSLYWTKSGLPFQQYSSGVFSTGISDASAYQTWTEGGGGNDTLTGTSSADLMLGKAGDDTISGGDGADRIDGGEGADVLSGQEGDDAIFGSTGNDTISGGDGNDLIEGGAGDDELTGGVHADVYVFGRGDGHDTIIESTSEPATDVDVIKIGKDIDFDDIHLSIVGSNLLIGIDAIDSDNSITVGNWSSTVSGPVEVLQLADGRQIDLGQVGSALDLASSTSNEVYVHSSGSQQVGGWFRTGSGQDQVTGTAFSDFFLLAKGDDTATGGLGGDSYFYRIGDGADTIIDSGSGTESKGDRLIFGSGLSLENVAFEFVGSDLKVHVGTFGIDGAQNLPTGGAILIEDWQTYWSQTGATIEFAEFAGGELWKIGSIHSAVLGAEFSAGEVSGLNDDTLSGTFDADWLDGFFGNDTIYGGAGNDFLLGRDGDDYLLGEGGNDNIIGGAGLDQIVGGDGDDFIAGGAESDAIDGGAGSDRIVGGDGDDVIVSGDGDDVIFAGKGNDVYLADAGSDVYRFGLGDGQDLYKIDAADAGTDVIEFLDGIDIEMLWFRRDGKDLLVDIRGTDDGIRFDSWFSDTGVDQYAQGFVTQEAAINYQDVTQLVDAMAGFRADDGFIDAGFSSAPLPPTVELAVHTHWQQA